MFVGQSDIIAQCKAIIKGEKWSVLLRGHYGYGKTELARHLASMVGNYHYYTASNALPLFSSPKPIIIDECHLISRTEALYELMEVNKYIFCTNMSSKLPEPFISRCFEFRMRPYTVEELALIVQLKCFAIPAQTAIKIAQVSRGNPRQAIRIGTKMNLLNTTDLAYVRSLMGIDENGLEVIDRRYLDALKDGPLGKNTLLAHLSVDNDELDRVEEYLLRMGMVKITHRGRCLNV